MTAVTETRLKLFAKSPCVVAEGPRWNAADNTLYWVDVTGGRYHRLRDGAAPDAFETVDPGLGKIGALACTGPGRVRLFTAGCRVWDCAFGETPVLRYELAGHETRRFNDVWIDADNTFCGVAREPDSPGELWLLRDGKFSCIEAATKGMPNGMGISPDGTTFYFTVTDERRIYAYDYDRASGRVTNRRVWADDFAEPGLPDGICVDPSDGSLWIAFWNGGRLEHRSGEGRLIESIAFPMKKVTSAEVVGRRVFVTTGNLESDAAAYFAETGAGSVFVLERSEEKA